MSKIFDKAIRITARATVATIARPLFTAEERKKIYQEMNEEVEEERQAKPAAKKR